MTFTDKIVVVTGAGSGIGRATAHALAAEGAMVVVADIDTRAGEATASAIRDSGQHSDFIAVDLTDRDSVNRFASTVQTQHGAVDILINAAGWGKTLPFCEGTPELWDKLIALNLYGPMQLAKALLPAMIERGNGRIVNVASDAGRVGSMGETVYSGAKGGLIAFTKSLAREVARHHINVNCVCPGPTDTPLMAAVPQKVHDALVKAIPFHRLAKPAEIADAIVFFASDRSTYVTGQVLSVSGGLTMAG